MIDKYLSTAKNSSATNSKPEPIPHGLLSSRSSRLPFSSRIFPEVLAASFIILSERYPTLQITSVSQLISLSLELLLEELGDTLPRYPTTTEALDILRQNGFIKPGSKRQQRAAFQAEQKFSLDSARDTSQMSPVEHYNYLLERDPQAAEELLAEWSSRMFSEADSGTDSGTDSDEVASTPERENSDPQTNSFSGLATDVPLSEIKTIDDAESD